MLETDVGRVKRLVKAGKTCVVRGAGRREMHESQLEFSSLELEMIKMNNSERALETGRREKNATMDASQKMHRRASRAYL